MCDACARDQIFVYELEHETNLSFLTHTNTHVNQDVEGRGLANDRGVRDLVRHQVALHAVVSSKRRAGRWRLWSNWPRWQLQSLRRGKGLGTAD